MSNQSLKHEREQRGWSQSRVAEQVGTDPGTVSRWERGFSSPSPYFREQLCQLYGKTAQELGLLEREQTDTTALEIMNSDVNQMEQTVSFTAALQNSDTSEEPLSPSVSARFRLLACFSILFGWVSGFLILLFYRSNRFVNSYSIQSVCFFGIVNLIIWVSGVYAQPYFEEVSGIRLLLNLAGSMTALVSLRCGFRHDPGSMGKHYRFP
jgi:transcriptional regulator with XRE-family HTH domain